jgi:hypothetical protein
MRKQIFFRSVLLAAFSLGIGDMLFAQKAGINGRVTDTTGAVIVGANVLVTSEDTDVKRRVVSNEDGYYTVELLQQGKYQVSVEMQGFKPIVRSGIELAWIL